MSKVEIKHVVRTEDGYVTYDVYNIAVCTSAGGETFPPQYEHMHLNKELLIQLRDAITAKLNEPL